MRKKDVLKAVGYWTLLVLCLVLVSSKIHISRPEANLDLKVQTLENIMDQISKIEPESTENRAYSIMVQKAQKIQDNLNNSSDSQTLSEAEIKDLLTYFNTYVNQSIATQPSTTTKADLRTLYLSSIGLLFGAAGLYFRKHYM